MSQRNSIYRADSQAQNWQELNWKVLDMIRLSFRTVCLHSAALGAVLVFAGCAVETATEAESINSTTQAEQTASVPSGGGGTTIQGETRTGVRVGGVPDPRQIQTLGSSPDPVPWMENNGSESASPSAWKGGNTNGGTGGGVHKDSLHAGSSVVHEPNHEPNHEPK